MRPACKTVRSTSASGPRRRALGAAAVLLALLVVMAVAAVPASAVGKAPAPAKGSTPTLVQMDGYTEMTLPQPASNVPLTGSWAAPAGGAAKSAKDSTLLFYDGFEGANYWVRLYNNGYTPVSWGDSTWRPYAGSWSAWCAGSGLTAPGPYANNMSAWMVTDGYVDLTGYLQGELDWDAWLDTENNYDFYGALVSVNGTNFYGPSLLSGYSAGWYADSIDLSNVPGLGNVCGQHVWIAYYFSSDGSNLATYEGAYVDEVQVYGVGGSGTSRLTLSASPLNVPFDGTTTLSGVLSDASTGQLLADRSIGWLWSQTQTFPMQWTQGEDFGSGTGDYSVNIIHIQRRTYITTYFAGDSYYDGTWAEGFVTVTSKARVLPPVMPSRIVPLKLVTGWGLLYPQHTAQQNRSSHVKLYLERKSSGHWVRVASMWANKYRNVGDATLYGFSLRYVAGVWRVRAEHKDMDHLKTTSVWRTFSVP